MDDFFAMLESFFTKIYEIIANILAIFEQPAEGEEEGATE